MLKMPTPARLLWWVLGWMTVVMWAFLSCSWSERKDFQFSTIECDVSWGFVIHGLYCVGYCTFLLYAFKKLYHCSITVVPPFSSLLTPTPPLPLPQSTPTPLPMPMSPLSEVLCLFLPLLYPIISSPLSCGHCLFVLYFQVCGSILLLCLFSWLDSTYVRSYGICRFNHKWTL